MAEYSHEDTNAQFPISIDLGKTMDDSQIAMPAGKKSDKGKKYFPTLYIDGVEGLSKLPDEGCALIKFKVRRDSTDRDSGKSSCELEVQSLCLPKDAADDPGDETDNSGADGDTGELVDEMAKNAGVKMDDEE